jgi:hypothetical protein
MTMPKSIQPDAQGATAKPPRGPEAPGMRVDLRTQRGGELTKGSSEMDVLPRPFIPPWPIEKAQGRVDPASRPSLLQLPPPPGPPERSEPKGRTRMREACTEEAYRRDGFVGMATYRMRCGHFREDPCVQIATPDEGDLIIALLLSSERLVTRRTRRRRPKRE